MTKQMLTMEQRDCYLRVGVKGCPSCQRLLFIDRIPYVDQDNARTRRFSSTKRKGHGLHYECKSCVKARNQKSYAKRVAAAKEPNNG